MDDAEKIPTGCTHIDRKNLTHTKFMKKGFGGYWSYWEGSFWVELGSIDWDDSDIIPVNKATDTVVISKEEYEGLLEDSRKLSLLYNLDLPVDLDEILLLNEEENNV